jgi:hypothetical protein
VKYQLAVGDRGYSLTLGPGETKDLGDIRFEPRGKTGRADRE